MITHLGPRALSTEPTGERVLTASTALLKRESDFTKPGVVSLNPICGSVIWTKVNSVNLGLQDARRQSVMNKLRAACFLIRELLDSVVQGAVYVEGVLVSDVSNGIGNRNIYRPFQRSQKISVFVIG